MCRTNETSSWGIGSWRSEEYPQSVFRASNNSEPWRRCRRGQMSLALRLPRRSDSLFQSVKGPYYRRAPQWPWLQRGRRWWASGRPSSASSSKQAAAYPERLLVYSAGTFRTVYLGCTKVTLIWLFGASVVQIAPKLLWKTKEGEDGVDPVHWKDYVRMYINYDVSLRSIRALADGSACSRSLDRQRCSSLHVLPSVGTLRLQYPPTPSSGGTAVAQRIDVLRRPLAT